MKSLVVDTEANGLFPFVDTVHCISYKWLGEEEVYTLAGNYLMLLPEVLKEADEIINHGFLGYDLLLWLKTGLIKSCTVGPDSINGKPIKFTDTLVMSRLLNPDRINGHGLDAWSDRTGVTKPKINDWSQYNEEVRFRCESDVRNNEKVYYLLKEEMK